MPRRPQSGRADHAEASRPRRRRRSQRGAPRRGAARSRHGGGDVRDLRRGGIDQSERRAVRQCGLHCCNGACGNGRILSWDRHSQSIYPGLGADESRCRRTVERDRHFSRHDRRADLGLCARVQRGTVRAQLVCGRILLGARHCHAGCGRCDRTSTSRRPLHNTVVSPSSWSAAATAVRSRAPPNPVRPRRCRGGSPSSG